MNKKKVLLCSPMKTPGGITQWTKHIKIYYESCINSCVDIDIFPMDRSEYIPEKMSILKRLLWGIKDYKLLTNAIIEKVNVKQYSIIHLASSASISLLKDLYILKKIKNNNIKTILHFHFGRIPQLLEKQNWEWKLLKKVIKLADHVIVIDKKSYDVLLKEGFANISLLPNPLSPQVEKIIKSKTNIERKDGKILFAGHVIKTKGVYELVEACSDIPNIELKLVGKILPKVEEDLRKLWNNKKSKLIITNNIAFEDVVSEMLSCNVFVLPTYTEGFPNVIIESMACACPIVATPVGAIPEMLNVGDTNCCGICVEPQAVKPLREAIIKMIEDKEFSSKCSSAARQRVIELYSMNTVWKQLLSIWNHI